MTGEKTSTFELAGRKLLLKQPENAFYPITIEGAPDTPMSTRERNALMSSIGGITLLSLIQSKDAFEQHPDLILTALNFIDDKNTFFRVFNAGRTNLATWYLLRGEMAKWVATGIPGKRMLDILFERSQEITCSGNSSGSAS